MKFVASIVSLVALSSLAIACSGSSRPAVKPTDGPPPEYEAPRSFELKNQTNPAPSEAAPPGPSPEPAPAPAP